MGSDFSDQSARAHHRRDSVEHLPIQGCEQRTVTQAACLLIDYDLSPLFELCVLIEWLQAGSLHHVTQAACLLIDTT